MDKDEIKNVGMDLKAIVRIGKKGINDSMVEEINRLLEDKEIIKIKVLRNNPIQDIEETSKILEDKTIGEVVEIRGKTILMYYEE
ncbi:MAG: YhbY family RNA-binding protein [Thermoplasmatota archaeon]